MKSCIRITDKEDGSHHIAVCAHSVENVLKYAIQV